MNEDKLAKQKSLEKEKNQPAVVEKKKNEKNPSVGVEKIGEEKKEHHVHDFVKKLKVKYIKRSKSPKNVKMKNETPSKTTQPNAKAESSSSGAGTKSDEPSSTLQDEEEAVTIPEDYLNKLASYLGKIMDLPVELYDQIISLLDINDFATIAELAESEGCVEIATFARTWITMQ